MDDVAQHAAAFAFGEPFVGGFIGDLVRGFCLDVKFLVPAIDDEVAITDAGVELEAGQFERARKLADQFLRLGVRNAARRVILHDPVYDRDEIAAEDPVGWREGDLLCRRLQRRAARVVNSRIVTQQTHRCDIAAAFEAIGHRARRSLAAFQSDAIHVGRVRGLDRRLAAQFLKRFVGGAVGNDDRIFHVWIGR